MSSLSKNGQKKYYLQNEVNTFLRLLETLGRMRDIRVFLLGNSADILNPYFLYFDLQLPYNNDIALFRDNTILLQYMTNQKYREAKKQTRFRKTYSSVLLTKITPLIINLLTIIKHLSKRNKVLLNFHLLLYIMAILTAFGSIIL